MNLDMHGAAGHEILHLDPPGSLGKAIEGRFETVDAIVTNPPFGSDLSDGDSLEKFQLGRGRPSRRRGVLFIERCLDLLVPGGVAAIILDDAVLNGPSNADVRRLVLERAELFAVVSLPDTAFMPYATVKASVLFMQKRGGRGQPMLRAEGTMFARAEVVGRKPNGDPLLRPDTSVAGLELDSDLPAIFAAWEGSNAARHATGSVADPSVFWARLPGSDDAQFEKDGFRLDSAYPGRRFAATRTRHADKNGLTWRFNQFAVGQAPPSLHASLSCQPVLQ